MVMDVGWTVSLSHAPGSLAPSPQPQCIISTLRLTTPVPSGAVVSGDAAELSALADQLANAIARDVAGTPV